MSAGAAPKWTELAAGGFALGYLALAIPAALDRASADRPELARFVPAAFQREVLAGQARQLRDAGIPGSALSQAEQLLRNDPLGADSAGLLGVARLARGDAAAADAAFRVSARVGWREPATQVYWFQTALAGGDYSLAALRFSAVARQWPSASAIDDMASSLQATPPGEAALIARLTSGEPWVPSFVLPGANEPAERLAARSDVLIKAADKGLRLGCAGVAALAQTLVSSDPQRADALWRRQCRQADDRALLYDGGLDHASATSRATVFDWGLPGSGALDSSIVADGQGNKQVLASNSSPTIALVLEQSVLLPAGTYRLSWQSDAANAAAAGRLQAALSCSNNSAEARPVAGQWQTGRHSAVLTFSGRCLLPSVQLWLAPGAQPVRIDDIDLQAG